MMKRLLILAGATSALLGTGHAGRAQSQSDTVHGVLENYLWAYSSEGRLRSKRYSTYLAVHVPLNDKARLSLGTLSELGVNQLEENALELGGEQTRWRIGRFRSAFGFSDWAECYYVGLPHSPLVQMMGFGNHMLMLSRLDTGVDMRGNAGPVEYQIGLIDPHAAPTEILPRRPDHVVTRLQTHWGNLMLGLNAFVMPNNPGRNGTGLYGVDWRWTVPTVQVRGELLRGRVDGGSADGYFLDLLYHPAQMRRTTFLVRTEGTAPAMPMMSMHMPMPMAPMPATGMHMPMPMTPTPMMGSSGHSRLFSVGIKQILSPLYTVELSHGWGNGVPPARSAEGWTLQWVISNHF